MAAMTVWVRNPNDKTIHWVDFDEDELEGDDIMAWYAVFDGDRLDFVTATLRGEGPEAAGLEDRTYDGPFDLWQREVRRNPTES